MLVALDTANAYSVHGGAYLSEQMLRLEEFVTNRSGWTYSGASATEIA